MTIQLLFFGITADLVGKSEIPYRIDTSFNILKLKEQLMSDFIKLKNIHEFAIAVNEEYAADDLILKDGDYVAIIPPVSGG
jgi:molybdopterin converting factor small subunit